MILIINRKKFTSRSKKIIVRHLGLQSYELILHEMLNFTNKRDYYTLDEIWLVEHLAVFTQGRIGKSEHILTPYDIPIIHSNRGGQVTYHGPGQQIMYVLLNLKRRGLNIRELIILLKQTVLNTLAEFNIKAHYRADAPGVYINNMKVCSIGLSVSKGCSSHGLALNVNMDLSPFSYINPCGYSDIKMTQICQWVENITPCIIRSCLIKHFLLLLNDPPYQYDSI